MNTSKRNTLLIGGGVLAIVIAVIAVVIMRANSARQNADIARAEYEAAWSEYEAAREAWDGRVAEAEELVGDCEQNLEGTTGGHYCSDLVEAIELDPSIERRERDDVRDMSEADTREATARVADATEHLTALVEEYRTISIVKGNIDLYAQRWVTSELYPQISEAGNRLREAREVIDEAEGQVADEALIRAATEAADQLDDALAELEPIKSDLWKADAEEWMTTLDVLKADLADKIAALEGAMSVGDSDKHAPFHIG